MCSRILIVLLIVLLQLIGGIDGSCSSFASGDNKSEVVEEGKHDNVPLNKLTEGPSASSYNISPGKLNRFFGRLTNKQLLNLSLVGVIALLCSGFIIHKANNSSASYDIVKEAKHVSASWDTSSVSIQDKLQNITTALCTRIPASNSDPPLENFTLSDTNPRATTELDNIETSTTDVNAIVDEARDLITAASMPNLNFTTIDPEPTCKAVAEKVHDLMGINLVGNVAGFIKFDIFNNNTVEGIQEELNEINENYCGKNFFSVKTVGDHSGIQFASENKYIEAERIKHACAMAADIIISVLDGMGFTSSKNCANTACRLTFETDKMKTNFHEGEKLVNENECGDDFFEITGSNEKSIKYHNSNSDIRAAWSKLSNDKKCQQRADAVIALLSDGHSDNDSISQSIIVSDHDEKIRLNSAYSVTGSCTCGDGAISTVSGDNNIVVTYKYTNPFVIKAWERMPEVKTCRRTAKDVFDYLKELGLYSHDEAAVLSIPNQSDYIPTFLLKLSAADGYNCKTGFFSYVKQEENLEVQYTKSNEYIKPEWNKVDGPERCKMTTHRLFEIFKLLNEEDKRGVTEIIVWPGKPLTYEMIATLSSSISDDCGYGFFQYQRLTSFEYDRISFRTGNEYVRAEMNKQGL